jgi:hypothetical protein
MISNQFSMTLIKAPAGLFAHTGLQSSKKLTIDMLNRITD